MPSEQEVRAWLDWRGSGYPNLPVHQQQQLCEDWLRLNRTLREKEADEQAVLDIVNLYGDALLHDQLDLIGWKPRAALAEALKDA